jgi:predicted DNA-binding transcriptional regulator AlpA
MKKEETKSENGAPLPSATSEQRWLRYPEVADRIGVCERTIRRDVNDGKLPKPIKLRGCVVFDWPAVAAALKQRQQI